MFKIVQLIVGVVVAVLPLLGQTPVVTSVSPAESTRSGRLVIRGEGFGARGTVTIARENAIVTQWHPTEIHAYVPESSPLGDCAVRVGTGMGIGKSKIRVAARSTDGSGRILWRFQTDRWMNRQFIGVGADGRVYISDQLGLYALSPAGALLWFAPGSGGGNAIDFLADGAIITGRGLSQGPELIKALNRDGSVRWEFIPRVSWDLLNGPNVGPDGNIYGAQDFTTAGGLGFLSLNPQGQLRWSNVGDPEIDRGLEEFRSEVVFGPNRAYSSIVRPRTSGQNPVTYAMDFQGNQIWETDNDLNLPMLTHPRSDLFGNVLGSWGQTGALSIQPDGDTNFIRIHPGFPNQILMPDSDSHGNVYVGDWGGVELWSLTPTGNTRWVLPRGVNALLFGLAISPDDRRLVAIGSEDGSASQADGWIRGYLPESGAFLWQVDFEREHGWPQVVNNLYPVFSRNETRSRFSARPKQVAYVSTRFANVLDVPHGYIYAIGID